MAMRKLLMTIAAGAVGLGALLFARDKGDKGNKKDAPPIPTAWLRTTQLANQQDHPMGLLVDGDFVYFVTGGFEKADNAVKRVRTAGGPVETLASGDFVISGHLTTDDNFVYWTNEWPGSVMRVAKTGGIATTILDAQPRPTFLAVDDRFVYFATYAKEAPGGTIVRVPKQGGPVELIASAHPYVSGLVLDERDCYWMSTSGLWKQSLSGGAATCLSTDDYQLTRLISDGRDLFFFVRSADPGHDYGVGRMAKAGGEITKLTPPAEWTLYLGLSDSHVYFFQHGSGRGEYVLQKVAKSGGDPQTIDVGEVTSGHIALSGGNAYFTDINTVYRVPK